MFKDNHSLPTDPLAVQLEQEQMRQATETANRYNYVTENDTFTVTRTYEAVVTMLFYISGSICHR